MTRSMSVGAPARAPSQHPSGASPETELCGPDPVPMSKGSPLRTCEPSLRRPPNSPQNHAGADAPLCPISAAPPFMARGSTLKVEGRDHGTDRQDAHCWPLTDVKRAPSEMWLEGWSGRGRQEATWPVLQPCSSTASVELSGSCKGGLRGLGTEESTPSRRGMQVALILVRTHASNDLFGQGHSWHGTCIARHGRAASDALQAYGPP